MSPDWNAIRLDLVGLDEPTRANLREMRPLFARTLPDILARFYDKVRQCRKPSACSCNTGT
jgi:hypothetical protein